MAILRTYTNKTIEQSAIKITKGALAPYISNLDHYCYYDKYDVAPGAMGIQEFVIPVE